jgi:hypothetical protein
MAAFGAFYQSRSNASLWRAALLAIALHISRGEQSCSDADAQQGASLLQRHSGLTFSQAMRHLPESSIGNANDTQLPSSAEDQGSHVARQSVNDTTEAQLAQSFGDQSTTFKLFELNEKFSEQRSGPHGVLFCRMHPCSLLLTQGDTRRGVGNTAPLNEMGYQMVAKVKDDSEMRHFILRAISKFDCGVNEEGGLMGLVPWFSGTTSVQSWEQLEDALLFELLSRGAHWIYYKNTAGITGANAALDLNGYVVVACLNKDSEMKKFARRLCQSLGVKITDEAGFDGMIKYFSGTTGFQSFERLQSEIQSAAAAPHTWATSALLEVNRESTFTVIMENPLNRDGKYTSDELMYTAGELMKPLKLGNNHIDGPEILDRTGVSTDDMQLMLDSKNQSDGDGLPVGKFSLRRSTPNGLLFCTSHPCSLVLSALDTRRGVGDTAPISEAGYQTVAAIKDDYEMKKFILRVLAKYDCEVTQEGGFMGLVPWFSGTTSVQSLEQLQDALLFELLSAGEHWLHYKNTAGITGDTASLDLDGYVVVACLRRDEDMKKFARRLCKSMGVKITDENGFDGMIKYFSGTTGFQSFERLQSEIQSAAAAPHTWASF